MKNNSEIKVSNLIYKNLIDQIKRGLLNPGEKIDERQISEAMKVSRTPVREALKQLESEGNITVIAKRGAFVRKYDSKELLDIYTVLGMLEKLAVLLTAPRLKKSEIGELRQMNNRMKKCSAKLNYREYLEENYRFHTFFSEIAQNSVLYEMITLLRKRIFRYQYMGITIPGNIEKYISYHDLIIDSIEKGKNESASNYIQEHVKNVGNILSDYYKKLE